MTKKLLMIAFPAVLGAMMLLGAVTGGSLNQEVFAVQGDNEKVDICHNTSSETNPQVTINVSVSAIPAHLSHGDFVGTCEDGPDCDHPTNADNPECAVPCPDCDAEYESAIEECGDNRECILGAERDRRLCQAENERNPECVVPCADCEAEYRAAIEECGPLTRDNVQCHDDARAEYLACLDSNAENPTCVDTCEYLDQRCLTPEGQEGSCQLTELHELVCIARP